MTARRIKRRLAILSVLAIAVAGSIAAGCGSKYVSVDKKTSSALPPRG
jgi:hypothetical protein